jgi:hypothetical protein
MSFGFSLGDVIPLSALAWNCYKSCRDLSEQFQRISREVGNLKAVLDETIEAVQDNQPLSPTREERLMRVMEECQQVLIDLEELLNSLWKHEYPDSTDLGSLQIRYGGRCRCEVSTDFHTTTLGSTQSGYSEIKPFRFPLCCPFLFDHRSSEGLPA